MHKEWVEAYNGTGTNKTFAGKREVDIPDTVEEGEKLWPIGEDGKSELLDYAISSYKIEVQRQIRAGTTVSAKKQVAALEAYVKANPDSEAAKTFILLMEQMKGKTVLPTDEKGGDEGGTTQPENPPAPSEGEAPKPEEKPAPAPKKSSRK